MQIEKWMSFSWMKFGLSGVFARNDSERFKNYSLFSNVFRDVSGLNRSFLVRSAEVSQYFFEILFWTETFRTHLALLKRLEVSGALWGSRHPACRITARRLEACAQPHLG
jgi:hypothetical protein